MKEISKGPVHSTVPGTRWPPARRSSPRIRHMKIKAMRALTVARSAALSTYSTFRWIPASTGDTHITQEAAVAAAAAAVVNIKHLRPRALALRLRAHSLICDFIKDAAMFHRNDVIILFLLCAFFCKSHTHIQQVGVGMCVRIETVIQISLRP